MSRGTPCNVQHVVTLDEGATLTVFCGKDKRHMKRDNTEGQQRHWAGYSLPDTLRMSPVTAELIIEWGP